MVLSFDITLIIHTKNNPKQSDNFRDADMTAVIILSHGADNGMIICSDGNMINVEEDVYK
jgi:hypothetical protein